MREQRNLRIKSVGERNAGFEKLRDKQTRNFVRARYKEDPVTKELTTDPKIRALELVLVRNTPPRN